MTDVVPTFKDKRGVERMRRAIKRALRPLTCGQGLKVTDSDGSIHLELTAPPARERSTPQSESFLAVLETPPTLMEGFEARWKYRISWPIIVAPKTDLGYTLREGFVTDFAYNLDEMCHIAEPSAETPWIVWGVDVHGEDYPDGFAPLPVGANELNMIVRVSRTSVYGLDPLNSNAFSTVYTFEKMGSHDGTCAAP